MMAPAGVKESEDLVPSKHGSFSRGFDPNITTYLISRSFNLNASLFTYSHGHSLTLVRLLDNHNINDGTLNGEKRSNTLLTRYYNIQKFQIKQHASLWL